MNATSNDHNAPAPDAEPNALSANDDAPPQPRSARVEYKAKLERARTMIATLTQLLDDHALEFVRKPGRWDLVADLGALNEKLGEAAAAIERTEVASENGA